ncbi:uncharacterized protein LOC119322387 [Triticum dicoccoides]|uniref:uncharacterized protein LOC119322387 n=1 Tax=Triticum dicoccoides TaxID=85692 RepID=UPI001890F166|nr:uncharacterized protein LOC119322387 [Triticum dicoccoides]
MILLSRVLKTATDGCFLVGHMETLNLLQQLMDTNGRCLSHATSVVVTSICHFRNGLWVAEGLCLCDVTSIVGLTIAASIENVFLSIGAGTSILSCSNTSGINIASSLTDSCSVFCWRLAVSPPL